MLLQEIDRNAVKFVPEPEAEKRERKNPLPWESGMIYFSYFSLWFCLECYISKHTAVTKKDSYPYYISPIEVGLL